MRSHGEWGAADLVGRQSIKSWACPAVSEPLSRGAGTFNAIGEQQRLSVGDLPGSLRRQSMLSGRPTVSAWRLSAKARVGRPVDEGGGVTAAPACFVDQPESPSWKAIRGVVTRPARPAPRHRRRRCARFHPLDLSTWRALSVSSSTRTCARQRVGGDARRIGHRDLARRDS
jgi:hypothetical protein